MLLLNQITHTVGHKLLYRDGHLQIGAQDKIALVGLNGVGKTTLFKIITGQIQPDEGVVQKSKAYTIGYLDQNHLSYNPEQSIRALALEAFPRVGVLKKQIDHLLQQMAQAYTEQMPERLEQLQNQFQQVGGYQKEARVDSVLEGMGFSKDQLEAAMSTFSGGWRMRALLAKLILEAPQLLLLDEPTNHLDIESIQWMENYLANYPNALVVISHDRAFLDRATNKTVEIAYQRFQSYAGNYSYYEQERLKQRDIQHRSYLNQQKHIAQQERFIQRFGAKASKAKQAKSKAKALEKLERVAPVAADQPRVKIQFGAMPSSGKCVAKIQNLDYAYGEHLLFLDAHAEIHRGDKIALIGANGKGKTTLLELICGQKQIKSDMITLGHNVKMAFYAQHQLESLNPQNNLLEEVLQANTTNSIQQVRAILGAFLFRKDAVEKKIGVLSGGEKARVALAKMIVQNPNFLILDEPTNHLDMPSVELLADALKSYPATLLFVSHNRDFIKRVASKIWYIEEAQIKSYPGTYAQYEFSKRLKTHE